MFLQLLASSGYGAEDTLRRRAEVGQWRENAWHEVAATIGRVRPLVARRCPLTVVADRVW